MDYRFDQASYDEGKAAFTAGATLLNIVGQCVASKPEDEDRIISGALGFADAFLEHIRSLSSRPVADMANELPIVTTAGVVR